MFGGLPFAHALVRTWFGMFGARLFYLFVVSLSDRVAGCCLIVPCLPQLFFGGRPGLWLRVVLRAGIFDTSVRLCLEQAGAYDAQVSSPRGQRAAAFRARWAMPFGYHWNLLLWGSPLAAWTLWLSSSLFPLAGGLLRKLRIAFCSSFWWRGNLCGSVCGVWKFGVFHVSCSWRRACSARHFAGRRSFGTSCRFFSSGGLKVLLELHRRGADPSWYSLGVMFVCLNFSVWPGCLLSWVACLHVAPQMQRDVVPTRFFGAQCVVRRS